jgi:hypothetical protein
MSSEGWAYIIIQNIHRKEQTANERDGKIVGKEGGKEIQL